MTNDRLSREYEIFAEVLDHPESECESILDAHCGEDEVLRARVRRLLASHELAEAAETLEHPCRVSEPGAPKTIGPYEVRSRLGEGGMGVVYAAEQMHPIRRSVAVKLLKWESDSSEVLDRFDTERQVLALMSHENIARILDAGVDNGRPYFVMEHIAGVPITAYCDRRELSIAKRLELFLSVCDGVQHAHQKGIIHRDIKPSNVLVCEDHSRAAPKIIDFGIAKAVTNRLLEATVHTEFGRIIGTPDYMSPEQADITALDVDTRSDIYSLGALLYELLCGSTVFDLYESGAGLDEIRSAILHRTPTRASDRFLSSEDHEAVARKRATTPDVLTRLLRQDLDWIVHKALEKDRGRRYASASEFADDIRRFLDGTAVIARPPSTSYRVRKFVRRNRSGVAAAAVLAIAIAVATTTSVLAAFSAQKQRAEAEKRVDDLERIAAFEAERLAAIEPLRFGQTIRDLVIEQSEADDDESLSDVNFTTVALRSIDRHLFEPTIREIDDKFAEDPQVRATLLQSAATTMARLGLAEDALDPQIRALELRTEVFGASHPQTAESTAQMAGLQKILGRFEEAEKLYREAISVLQPAYGINDPRVSKLHNELGLVLLETGRYEEAESELQLSLRGFRQRYGEKHADTVKVLNDIGLVLGERGQHEESLAYLKKALDASRHLLEPNDERLLAAITNVGGTLIRLGRIQEGVPYFEEALEGFRVSLGDDHFTTMTMVSNMGYLKQELGEYDEAERFYLESLESRRRHLGEDHTDTLVSEVNLANLYAERGTPEQSVALLQHVVEIRRRELGETNPRTINAVNNMASVYRATSQPEESLRLTSALVQDSLPHLPPGHSLIGSVWNEHARTLLELERYEEAAHAAEVAYDARIDSFGSRHPTAHSALKLRVTVYEEWDRVSPDSGHDRTAAELRTRLEPSDDR